MLAKEIVLSTSKRDEKLLLKCCFCDRCQRPRVQLSNILVHIHLAIGKSSPILADALMLENHTLLRSRKHTQHQILQLKRG